MLRGCQPERLSPPGAPLPRYRCFVTNETVADGSPRSGFHYPRYDARLHDGDEVQLRSTHDTWLSVTTDPRYALAGTDSSMIASVLQTGDSGMASTFVVVRANLIGLSIALRCKINGGYLAVDGVNGALGCSAGSPWTITSARVSWWDMKLATFQSPSTGHFFRAGPRQELRVRADGTEASGWSLWKVFLVGGYETIRPMIRGVNLGNWFLIERWMDNELFYDEAGEGRVEGNCSAMDERGLMDALGPEVSKERMERHWSTWIVEDDIAWLSRAGINTVRVPFGYWMVAPSRPFVPGQLGYLDRLFRWCEKYQVAVLLDFHGLRGSQTGNPTSGDCGACGHDVCGETHINFLGEEEQRTNLQVISVLSRRYSRSPVYLGFEVANEVDSSADRLETMRFYQKAYNIIRESSEDALVVLYSTFEPSGHPWPNFQNTAVDIHIYFGWAYGTPTLDQQENLRRTRISVASKFWPVVVSEWTLAESGHNTLHWEPARREKFMAEFARMQLQSWETYGVGWFYWSYKTSYRNSTWNFRDMCTVGWLPGCKDRLRYASPEWWHTPGCAYAYLDGQCSGHEEMPVGGKGAGIYLEARPDTAAGAARRYGGGLGGGGGGWPHGPLGLLLDDLGGPLVGGALLGALFVGSAFLTLLWVGRRAAALLSCSVCAGDELEPLKSGNIYIDEGLGHDDFRIGVTVVGK